MTTAPSARAPWWTWAAPLLAAAATVGTLSGIPVVGWTAALVGAILIAAVFAAVFHAEVVAHRVGEPFGTLVLAVAVTIIEVALIVSVMLEGGADKAALARDTVFAAVMIVCNGIVGLCLLAGARAPSCAGVPAPGRARGAGRPGRADRAHARRPERHHDHARP